jgi:hypothetical protein
MTDLNLSHFVPKTNMLPSSNFSYFLTLLAYLFTLVNYLFSYFAYLFTCKIQIIPFFCV